MPKANKPGLNFTQTKEERARRNAKAKGQVFVQSKESSERWSQSQRELERKAMIDYGVSVKFEDVQSHNCRLYR